MLENFILAIFFPAISLQFTANYCNSKLCGYTDAHTLCQYKRGPGPDCAGYIAVNLTDEDVLRIVERLNRRRSDIASGRGRMPPAGNMLKLRWVDELAREAQIWADQCRRPKMPEEHDLCRDLYSIQVGQCVASVTGDAPGIRPESMVDMWYLQSHYYKANVVSYVSPNNTTKYYGDFAQFIWAKTYMVGCGRSRFMVPFDGRFRSVERLVCNFAPRGPVPGRPLWTTAPPATACPARSQPDYEFPALCTHNYAIDEPYDMHGSLTLDEHRALSSLIILEQDRSAGVQRSLDDIFMSKLNMEKPLYLRKRSAENVTEVNTLASSAVKENLVGRPKSYELEELNDANSHKVENETQFDFPTTTKGKDYEDYILIENGEDFNVSIDHNDDVNNGTKHENDEDENSNAHERSYQNATILSELSKLTNYLIDIDQNQSSENVSRTKSESDNLSEPDMARELIETLDQMEQELSTSLAAQPKVRRELRGTPPKMNQINEIHKRDTDLEEVAMVRRHKYLDEVRQESEKRIERSHGNNNSMLGFLSSYVPYFKQYEGQILGKMLPGSADALSASYGMLVLCNLVL